MRASIVHDNCVSHPTSSALKFLRQPSQIKKSGISMLCCEVSKLGCDDKRCTEPMATPKA